MEINKLKGMSGKKCLLPAFFYSAIFFLLLAGSVSGHTRSVNFKHLTINEGLSQNEVFAIIQDRKGFMWFGTKDGLNRYDGYNFVVYKHNPFDTTTISASYITELFEDSRGMIWVGTFDGGLNVFDPEFEIFHRIQLCPNGSRTPNAFKVESITEDPQGDIWVGTRGDGIYRLQVHRHGVFGTTPQKFMHEPVNSKSVCSNIINALHFDKEGTMWIGTRSGLDQLNLESGNFIHFKIQTRNPLVPENIFQSSISSIFESKNGTLWLGTLGGLVRFNKQNGSYKLYPHRFGINGDGWGNILQIIEDQEGYLWLANAGELMRFDPGAGEFTYFSHDPFDPKTISFNSISSLFIDKSQMLWFGTTGMGLSIYDPKANRFPSFEVKKSSSSRVTGFCVRSILEDNQGDIWISTEILYKWDRKTGKITSFEKSVNKPDSFGNTGAWSMIQTGDGNIWAATSEGVYRYHPLSSAMIQYKFDPDKSNGLPQQQVYAVFEDQDKGIWVATEKFLCKLIDADNGTFRCMRYLSDPTFSDHVSPVIFQDINKSIWLGAKDGLRRLNADSASFTVFQNDPLQPSSLSNNHIKSICADPVQPDKYIWIGTTGGLNRFDMKRGTFIHFSQNEGLPNNVIYGILPDNENNLWMSTNKGISCFNPQTRKFRNYDVYDGLQSNEFNTGGYFRSKSGELFFGGIKGLNYFNPADIHDNPHKPVVVLTKIALGDHSISHRTHPDILPKAIVETKEIVLSYYHDIITFEYAALDFSAPEKNRYAYMLENFSHEWIFSGSVRTATFTHLPPGEYVFRVKATNNAGVWNDHGLAITLVIKPPWWFTWWAYMLYGLFFFAGIYLVRHYEINRMRLRNQLKLEKVEIDSLRNMDLLKSQFFTNISHEFRTPLTLILGQIENVMSTGIDLRVKAKLQVVNRNARRLLTLINQLLDLSKLEAGSMELHTSQHNIVSFLKSLLFSFESLAAAKQIKQRFYSEMDFIPVVFDQDMIEKVFYNLVSNAFKFVKAEGEVQVVVQVIASDFVEIRVEDDGPGISEEQLPYLFDRFYQVDNSITRKYEGTGIGLALSKELVELHQGTLTAESREGKYTAFIIRLPVTELNHDVGISDLSSDNQEYSASFPAIIEIDKAEELTIAYSRTSDDNREIILIVEDNLDVRAYIREQFEGDYLISEAGNGEAGFRLAGESIPDLIITDLMMPKIDGFQFCKEIRKNERTSHIPIIMLTAKAGFDDKMEGLETGIDDYITKPFSARELKVRVRNLINQRRLLRTRFHTSTIIKPSEVTGMSVDQKFLEKVIRIIEANFEIQDYTIESLANELNMSVSQLNRKLNALIDQPAGQLMRSLRLQRAADLLKKKTGTVAEICYQLGFNDQAYFSRAFKKQFSCSPSEYMKA